MPLPPSIRSLIPLLLGLAVGGVGATLFLQSMPAPDGSAEERANRLEVELLQAQKRIAAQEAANAFARHNPGSPTAPERPSSHRRTGRTLADGARSIAEDIREGRAVNPEDVFRASQPLLRDLAPLFDRMRVRAQRQMIDSMTGELARKYNLPPQSQEMLKQWFEAKSQEQAQQWSELIGRDDTRLEDVIRASRDVRPDEGLDTFVGGILSGDQLTAFKTERLGQRAARVQQEVDMRVQRLDAIVGLDEAQRDQVFAVMARSSRDYDPAMALEGATGQIGATPGGDRQAAMLAVLRPDQRAAYEKERARRREEAAKGMAEMGMALPPDWEMLDDADFR